MINNSLGYEDLCLLTVVVSILFHKTMRRCLLASCLAGLVSGLVFLCPAVVRLDYFDGWFLIGVCFVMLTSMGVAIVIGALVEIVRRKHPKAGHCPKCNYSLRGLCGTACPECGYEVSMIGNRSTKAD